MKSVGGRLQITAADNATVPSKATRKMFTKHPAKERRYCHTAEAVGCVTSWHRTGHKVQPAQQVTKEHRAATTSHTKAILHLMVPLWKSFLSFTCTSNSFYLWRQNEKSESTWKNVKLQSIGLQLAAMETTANGVLLSTALLHTILLPHTSQGWQANIHRTKFSLLGNLFVSFYLTFSR